MTQKPQKPESLKIKIVVKRVISEARLKKAAKYSDAIITNREVSQNVMRTKVTV